VLARAEATALGIVVCGLKPRMYDGYHRYYRAEQNGEARVRQSS